MIKPITKLIIDRSVWLPNNVQDKLDVDSRLLEEQSQRMCCLGIACLSAGISRRAIANKTMPYMLGITSINKFKRAYPKIYDEPLLNSLADANDNHACTSTEREREIKRLFKLGGVSVKFIGRLFPKKRTR